MSAEGDSVSTPILAGALLGIIEAAGLAVATLAEGLQREELLSSRLTRVEVKRQLRMLADSAAGMPGATRDAMPEVDWRGWESLAPRLAAGRGEELDEALWFAVESLVPATLLWLRVYRRSQASLFEMRI